MKPSIRQKLDLLVDRLDEIDRMLSAPDTANDMDQFRRLARERAELEPLIVQFNTFRELLPNLVPALLAYALLLVAVGALAEAGLSFLGLGVPPPACPALTRGASGSRSPRRR